MNRLTTIKFILVLILFSSYYNSQAATLTVCASGCDHTTITAAIAAASAGDIIDIQDATHTEAGITVDKDLTIQGQGQTTTTVQAAATQAAATDRVFTVNTGLVVTFQNFTIQNGNLASGNGGGVTITSGAATNISFINVIITNNKANAGNGGGVSIGGSTGTVTFTDCVVSNNEVSSQGGGLYNSSATILTLTRCTVSGNTAAGSAGGGMSLNANSVVKLINCTVSNNALGAPTTGNSFGGGIYLNQATSYHFINCTIVNNSLVSSTNARLGGGIYMNNYPIELINTIVANNSGATSASNGDDIYSVTGSFTQTTSLVEDCDGNCPVISYTDATNIATTASACGVHSAFDITGSDAENNGTAPSGDIPTDDICGTTRVAAHDIGSADVTASTLPVELISFRGKSTLEGTLLIWQTATEKKNEGFEIEHSINGRTWNNIGFVQGNGTSNELNNYEFIHRSSASGTNYYRLKQIDFDEQFEYSHIVNVNYELGMTNDKLKLFPNPVKNELHIIDGQGQATIYNLLGQPVRQLIIDNEQLTINVSDLPNGQYILHILQQNGNVITKRFIK